MKQIENPEPEVVEELPWFGMDTENDSTGKVTLVALVGEDGYSKVWTKAGEFHKWCDESNGAIVICHNLEYDLVNEFGDHYPYLQLNYLKGRLISAKYKKVKFLDSGNHFRMPLKKLGECLGLQKLAMDIHSKEYVLMDATICLKAMCKARDYIASIGGKIGATSGSSSVSVWRSMTEDEFCLGPIDNPWFRQGYFGGRTELFATQGSDVRGYDINSMYPFVMLNDFPEYVVEDKTMIKAKGMAEVTIHLPEMTVAPLVYRDPDGRLTYPIGLFRGVWTYDELRFAEKLGGKIQKIHKAYGGNSLLRPFDQYINTLYSKRKASTDESERLFLKVLMNSLYGKISAKNVISRAVSRHTLINNKSTRLDEVRWINHHRGLLDYTTPPQKWVNLIWGSMITAYSRILLTKYLLKVPEGQLIYCDTDSIYCSSHQFETSSELGGLKLEKEAKIMRVLQPKCYCLDDDYFIAKGVPKPRTSEDGLVIDFAKQYIEEGYTEFNAPIRFINSLRSKRGKANQWVTMKKARRSEYKHKTLSNGRYYPPVLGMQLDLFKSVT